MRRHARALVAALTLGLVLAGCSGGSDTATKQTPAQQLAAAKKTVDAARSLHLVLRSSGIPASAGGVIGADGVGTHAPAFKGTLDARISGIQAKVDVVATGGQLYLKLPFTTTFAPVDPKQYNAPDPATLFSADTGLSTLLTATQNPTLGEKKRQGSEVLQTVKGTIPGKDVVALLGSGDANGTFDATYGITDPGGQLRTISITGPFFSGARSTYTLTLDRYGAPVEISRP
ncbi:LppX_LprAFG lipoprotein [Oryzihumus sp.]